MTFPEKNSPLSIARQESVLGRKDRETREFLSEILKRNPLLPSLPTITSIYYPGCGVDFVLDDFFKPHQITYLDRSPMRKDVKQGNFGSTPDIPDGLFDALFLQDIHQDKKQMAELLRTLRIGGVVIQGTFACGLEGPDAVLPEQLETFPGLKKDSLTLRPHPFITFVKIK